MKEKKSAKTGKGKKNKKGQETEAQRKKREEKEKEDERKAEEKRKKDKLKEHVAKVRKAWFDCLTQSCAYLFTFAYPFTLSLYTK